MFTRWEYRLWRRRRRRRRIALTLAAALLLAVVVHGGRTHPHHHHHMPAASPSSHPAQRARKTAPAAEVGSRGTGPAESQAETGIATAGQGLRWRGFHGIELPYSAQDGPHHTLNGLAWGFTDTPRGALLAALNIALRTAAVWGPKVFGPTIRRQVIGPDAGALLRADISDYAAMRAAANVGRGEPAGRGYAAEAAYRFLAFTPVTATVDIVTEGPGSGGSTVMTATRIQVIWRRGDWRVIAPPNGDWATSATPVSSLAGYTSFASEG